MPWIVLLIISGVLWVADMFILPSGVSSPALEAMPRYRVGMALFVVASTMFVCGLIGLVAIPLG